MTIRSFFFAMGSVILVSMAANCSNSTTSSGAGGGGGSLGNGGGGGGGAGGGGDVCTALSGDPCDPTATVGDTCCADGQACDSTNSCP